MFFKESKRLKKKADKAKLRDFKRDIFDEAIPVATTVATYFKFTARTEPTRIRPASQSASGRGQG